MTRIRKLETAGRASRDEGSVSLFVVAIVLGLFAMLGLVVDGSARLVAQQRVTNQAEQAARAAAQSIDVTALRDGNPATLDIAAATQAATAYLSAVPGMDDPQVHVTGTAVTVTVHTTVQPQILSIAGIGPLTVTGSGSAQLLRGTTTGDTP
jgi:Flp pilus assembly protein TadG